MGNSSAITDSSSQSLLLLPCKKKQGRKRREENFSVSEIKLGPLWETLSWSPLPLSEKVEKADLWKSYRS